MKRIAAILAFVGVIAGCDTDGPVDVDAEVEGVEVLTTDGIEYMNDTIRITPENPKPAGLAGLSASADLTYDVVRVARSPVLTVKGYDGNGDLHDFTVQANDILLDAAGRRAYIAYNYQGGPWVGALQILDVSNSSRPRQVVAYGFDRMDINALYLDGNQLVIAGAINPDVSKCTTRSFVMRLDLRTQDQQEMMDSLVCLPSYAATGVTRYRNNYYVSVGALDGAIHVLDLDLNPVTSYDRGDVRDIAHWGNGTVALAGTTDTEVADGHVIVTRGEGVSDVSMRPIEGFGSDYHKATVEVYEGTIALLGLSEAGWKVIDMRNPDTDLASFANPECTGPELECNTNSVSTDGDLIFTANGQYGFRVYRPRSKGGFDDIEPVGYYDVQSDESWDTDWDRSEHSANHVEVKARNVFVASGLLGVFMYVLEDK